MKFIESVKHRPANLSYFLLSSPPNQPGMCMSSFEYAGVWEEQHVG